MFIDAASVTARSDSVTDGDKARDALDRAVYAAFEVLFDTTTDHGDTDCKQFDLAILSKTDHKKILVDCLMYEDDRLFASALHTLNRE